MRRIRRWLSRRLESALRSRGFVRLRRQQTVVEREALYDWQWQPRTPLHSIDSLPPGAVADLRMDHPRLAELRARYASCDAAVITPSSWIDGHVSAGDLVCFRGDNAYVWQLRGKNLNAMSYALTAYYVPSVDRLHLLDSLEEDSLFGCNTFRIAGRVVSRDLLDSIVEISFLERHLGISAVEGFTVLDIGAGYGRLAHRMTAALPRLGAYLCTDAVAESTFISEYYLRFRGVTDKAAVIPLDEIEETLSSRRVDLAVNVHSFSECRLEAIEWWLSLLARFGVRHFMVAPNHVPQSGSALFNQEGRDFGAVIERHGYQLLAREPMYADPIVQEFGLSPTEHYLFELGGTPPRSNSPIDRARPVRG